MVAIQRLFSITRRTPPEGGQGLSRRSKRNQCLAHCQRQS